MIEYEDNCVGCPSNMGCIGSLCPYKNVPTRYCDGCDELLDDEYYTDGEKDYCEECYLKEIGYDDSLTLENAEIYGGLETETIELNSFWATQYTAEQIEKLCEQDFKKQPEAKQIEDINGFVESCYKDEWIDYFGLDGEFRKEID